MLAPYALTLEAIDSELDAANMYLEMTAKSDELAGIATETKALIGPVATTILSVAQSLETDLIVMCSHGYTRVIWLSSISRSRRLLWLTQMWLIHSSGWQNLAKVWKSSRALMGVTSLLWQLMDVAA
jgi:hypothetical protein